MEDKKRKAYATRNVETNKRMKHVHERFKVESVNAYWIVKEKEKILSALREHGCSDYERLSKAVGTKSVEQVKYFLKQREQFAKKKGNYSNVSPVEMWIEKILRNLCQKCDYSIGLAKVLSRCVQRQHSEVYEFLVLLLRNELPRDLSLSSNKVVLRLLQDLATLIQSLDLSELQEALTKGQQQQTADKSNEVSPEDDILKFYVDGFEPDGKLVCSFNPLKLCPSVLCDMFLQANQQMNKMFAKEGIPQ